MVVRPRRIALALGSGGARGYAHIGAIEELCARGYQVVSVAGSSMGAVVGGVFAAGKLEPFTSWVRGLTARDVLRLLDPAVSAPGAIKAERIFAHVGELLEGARIEELPLPFTAVSTDLLTRREVWFREGPLALALRASIALPSFVTPIMWNGRLLADGGLLDPVPITPALSAQADAVVAISLIGERRSLPGDAPERETGDDRRVADWQDRLRRSAAYFAERDALRPIANLARQVGRNDAVRPAGVEDLPGGLRTLDVMNLSLDAMQNLVLQHRLASHPPDVLVTVAKDACRTLDFHRANEMIDLGRRVTAAALDAAGFLGPDHRDGGATPGAGADPTAAR